MDLAQKFLASTIAIAIVWAVVLSFLYSNLILSIVSVVLGCLGSLLFVVYKAKSGKKNSLIVNISKFLIAISLILLITSLFIKRKEKFTSIDETNYVIKPQPPPQLFLVEISNLNPSTYYDIHANDFVVGTVMSDTNGVINFNKIIKPLSGLPMPLYNTISISPSDSKASFTTDSKPKPKFVFASLPQGKPEFKFIGHINDKQGPTKKCTLLTYTYTVKNQRITNFGSPTLTHAKLKHCYF